MGEPFLALDRVSKRYGETVAVADIDLSIQRGEFVVLLGPSGSGKSTTLRLIAGLETPDSGEIFLRGKRIEHLRARDRNIGVISRITLSSLE